MKIAENLKLVSVADKKIIACSRCEYVYGLASENVKTFAKMKTFPITKAGPMLNPWVDRNDFELREFYCPSCATMISVELNKKEEPILWDIALA